MYEDDNDDGGDDDDGPSEMLRFTKTGVLRQKKTSEDDSDTGIETWRFVSGYNNDVTGIVDP